MRKKPSAVTAVARAVRNIPAYAGKTGGPPGPDTPGAEHPRVCGKTDFTHPHKGGKAEHPRVCGENGYGKNRVQPGRGKLFAGPARCGSERNIPAYAGKTMRSFRRWGTLWEHPRVCGENISTGVTTTPSCGTSPRMRGKHVNIILAIQPNRNIPAYAGKTAVG